MVLEVLIPGEFGRDPPTRRMQGGAESGMGDRFRRRCTGQQKVLTQEASAALPSRHPSLPPFASPVIVADSTCCLSEWRPSARISARPRISALSYQECYGEQCNQRRNPAIAQSQKEFTNGASAAAISVGRVDSQTADLPVTRATTPVGKRWKSQALAWVSLLNAAHVRPMARHLPRACAERPLRFPLGGTVSPVLNDRLD
jgi:hypothetical protein